MGFPPQKPIAVKIYELILKTHKEVNKLCDRKLSIIRKQQHMKCQISTLRKEKHKDSYIV